MVKSPRKLLKERRLVPLLVIAAAVWAYHDSFHDVFVFDDIPHISENTHIHQLWPLGDVLRHSSRPVVQLSLAVNYALGGIAPWGYHLFNVAIHVLVALTLYGVVRRTLLSEALRPAFGRAASSLAGAITLIWLVHPLQTECVTYTIQRGESLMSLFYLLTLYCVIRGNDSSRANLWKISAVVSCALGIACKPVMVTVPLVVLLYHRAFLVKSWRDIMRRWGWLYAGLAASWLLVPPLLANAPTDWKTSAGFGFNGIPPFQYALMQSVVILRYLRLAVWPHPLCLDYGWGYQWQSIASVGIAWPALIVVMTLLAGTVWAWNRKPALGFLGAWFFLILAPTSSFLPIADPIAEHRMYLPLAAIVTGVVVVAFVLGQRFLRNQSGPVLGWVACGLVVVPLAVLTTQRNRDYASEFTIWQDTAVRCPQNPRAHSNLGLALLHLHKGAEAREQLEQALRLKPDYADAHCNLGLAFESEGRMREAIEQYEWTLRLNPDYPAAHNNLANALVKEGKLEDAVPHYEEALRLKPDYANAHNNFGVVLVRLGRPEDGIRHYEEALHLDPDYANAHYNLGAALEGEGRVSEAIEQYQQALKLRPDMTAASNALAQLRSGQ